MYYFITRLTGQGQASPFLYTLIIVLTALVFVNSAAHANLLIPTDNASPFYYQLGGSSTVSLPASSITNTLDLGASLSIHPGYQCGIFNPAVSLRTTLNKLHDKLANIKKTVSQNLTAAIAEFPMYELARLNPTLYNIVTHNLLQADAKIRLATKSCEQMQAEIGQGKNPYKAWATLAVGHQWEKHIGLALEDDAVDDNAAVMADKTTQNDPRSITSVKKAIDAKAGEAGVPWIQGEAGGPSQPAIHVIKDTATTGYNLLKLHANSHLKAIWPTSAEAAQWVVQVIGDQVISADPKKARDVTVGQGLLPFLVNCPTTINKNKTIPLTCTQQFADKLQQVVNNPNEITQKNLTALSSPALAISPRIIHALHSLSPLSQTLFIGKLAPAMALQTIVDKALLARRLLLTGMQKPVIASNAPAMRVIQAAIARLEKDIDALLWEKRIRGETLVAPLQQLLRYTQAQQHRLAPSQLSPTGTLPQHGTLPYSTQENTP